MPFPLPHSDEALKKQVSDHVQSGNIADAKRMASQISEPMLQREAWLEILYTLRDRLKDLRAVKETILSLPDSKVWLGSWVHDFVLDTARSGDISGAKAIVERVPQDHLRENFYSLIASVQAHEGDYQGAQSTVGIIPPDSTWHDLGLAFVIRGMLDRGDRGEAEALADQIVDSQIKTMVLYP